MDLALFLILMVLTIAVVMTSNGRPLPLALAMLSGCSMIWLLTGFSRLEWQLLAAIIQGIADGLQK